MAIYDDLLIRILKRQAHRYPVELTLNNKLEFRRGYLSSKILTWDEDAPPEDVGRRFFEQLIDDPKVAAAWDMVQGRTQLRRIRLVLDADAPELHALPWELMRERADQGGLNLAAADATPFSRYLEGEWDYGEPIQRVSAQDRRRHCQPRGTPTTRPGRDRRARRVAGAKRSHSWPAGRANSRARALHDGSDRGRPACRGPTFCTLSPTANTTLRRRLP